MTTITSTSYFTYGSLYIPNAQGATGALNASTNGIEPIIARYEREVIINGLNKDIYDLLIERIEQREAIITPDPNYVNDYLDYLLDGQTYDYEGKTYTFKGLLAEDGLLPFYIFNRYLNDNFGKLGMDAMTVDSSSSAQIIDATPKDVETWNVFVMQYQGDAYANNSYPVERYFRGGIMLDYYREDARSGFVDLLTYVDHYEALNEGTYSDLNRFIYERKNSFGL
jgi:hypothetical protein